MTGKTHQIIGITAGLSSFLLLAPLGYNPATFAAVLVVSSVGSLLPDIDQPASKLWHSLPFGNIASEFVNPFLEHRNLTHSFLGFGLVSFLVLYLLSQAPVYWGLSTDIILVAFLSAYGSHLLADMVTVQGIPLFFPIQRMIGIPPRPFEGIRIQTGEWFENVIVFPVANAAFLTLIVSYWPIINVTLFK
ncbi:MAG: Membrane protein containing transrane [Patescibacteria group bacterium]|jgi:membrane-bound metal-dependent hydrolase YbcI (DUF457 family)|nr:Membrane protein containing transrane [Patescibacteria group bacterium]